MIIVSQDETDLINFNNIVRLSVDVNTNGEFLIEAHNFCDDFETVIGVYGTKERAKEVLQEIRRTYKMSESLKVTKLNLQVEIIKEMEKSRLDAFVYEMPKE